MGDIPPQLVPEHLASVEQHRLELVRAVDHASELLNISSGLFEHVPELFEHASELSEHASELFVWLLEPSTLEARVCQKDVRSSSKKKFKVSTLGEVCPLRFRASKLVAWHP